MQNVWLVMIYSWPNIEQCQQPSVLLGDLHEIFVAEFQRSAKADIDANGHSHNIRAWSPTGGLSVGPRPSFGQ